MENKLMLMVFLGVMIFVGIITVSMYFSFNNDEVSLRNEAEAQRGNKR